MEKENNNIFETISKSIKDFINGELIFRVIRNNLKFVFFIFLLLILYLANHKYSADSFRQITKLENDLEIKKSECIELQSINASKRKITKIEKMSKVPPKKIKGVKTKHKK